MIFYGALLICKSDSKVVKETKNINSLYYRTEDLVLKVPIWVTGKLPEDIRQNTRELARQALEPYPKSKEFLLTSHLQQASIPELINIYAIDSDAIIRGGVFEGLNKETGLRCIVPFMFPSRNDLGSLLQIPYQERLDHLSSLLEATGCNEFFSYDTGIARHLVEKDLS